MPTPLDQFDMRLACERLHLPPDTVEHDDMLKTLVRIRARQIVRQRAARTARMFDHQKIAAGDSDS